MDRIEVIRKTTESKMSVTLDFSPLSPDYRSKIDTPIVFLNHMIEHIAWRSGVNVELKCELDKFMLTHVICEDLGIALGKAVSEYISKNTDKGVIGYGDGLSIIDEARAITALSFEGRAYFNIEYRKNEPAQSVEGMYSEDLVTFLEGFAQGACCTMHVVLDSGVNGHHIWEAIFRSFGVALKNTLAIDPQRAGMTSGVAGKINWEINS